MRRFTAAILIIIGILVTAVVGWRFYCSRNIQTVVVEYQRPDGSYGDSCTVINHGFKSGSTVRWKFDGDDIYEPAGISYKATLPRKTTVLVKRRKVNVSVSGNSKIPFELYINGQKANPSTTALIESSYRIDVQPKDGYAYAGMSASGVPIALTGKLKKDTRISLHSLKKRYKDSVSFSDGESYSFSTAPGETITLGQVIHPSEGTKVKKITVDGLEKKKEDSFIQPKKNVDISVDVEEIEYHVTYKDAGDSNPNPETYKGTLELQSPTKEGYTFAYWKDANGRKVTSLTHRNADLTAVWKQNVSITYYANDGTDTSQTREESIVGDNLFTRTGYTFAGWNTKADGTGKTYKTGDFLSSPTSLYAIWKETPTENEETQQPNENTDDNETDTTIPSDDSDSEYQETIE